MVKGGPADGLFEDSGRSKQIYLMRVPGKGKLQFESVVVGPVFPDLRKASTSAPRAAEL